MKRFTSSERGTLVLAVVFFVTSFVFLVWPQETVVVHPVNDVIGWQESVTSFVSKTGSRIYGVIAMFIGAGTAALVLYRPRD